MPSSYSIYEMKSFPDTMPGQTIEAPRQMQLIQVTNSDAEGAKTIFEHKRNINDLDIVVFRALHEYVVPEAGRTQEGVRFTSYIAEKHFPAFYVRKQGLLLLKVKKEIATGAMKQLNKSVGVQGKRRDIYLDSIKNLIAHLRGAWFRVSDSADVNSQALFGPSIGSDLRFERASAEGAMYNLSLDYSFLNELFHVGISEDGSVVLYTENIDEQLELELVLDVKKTLLDKAKNKNNS